MDDAEFGRERDALQSRIDELTEVLRRLTEILEAAAAQIHEHDDDGQLAVAAGGADSYCYGDEFYPGNDDNPSDDPEYPMPWEHHYYLYNDTFGQQLTVPDGTAGHLQLQEEAAGEAAGSGGDHGGQYLQLSDPALYDDNDHDMTAGVATPARFSDVGFGGVQASAPAIASLRDGQLAVVAGGGDSYYGDDFYPGNDNPFDEPEYLMQLERHYYLRNDTFGQQLTVSDDTAGHLQLQEEAAGEAAGSGGDHGDQYLLSDPALYEDDDHDHDMTAGEATPARFSDGGDFGGVPASAAAIASLKKQRHDGSGADSMCTICMRHYKKGKRLSVMPCAFKHRFHRKCLKKWLSRSHLCPLCRHALPTEDQSCAQATGTQDALIGTTGTVLSGGSIIS